MANISGISIVKGNTGFFLRQSRSKNYKFKNSPNYERVRAHCAEFSTTAKAGKLLRQAMRYHIRFCNDKKVTQRVFKIMREILLTDQQNRYGYRRVENGNISLLEGFTFGDSNKQVSMIAESVNCVIAKNKKTISVEFVKPTDKLLELLTGGYEAKLFISVSCIDFSEGCERGEDFEIDIHEFLALDKKLIKVKLKRPSPCEGKIVVSAGFVNYRRDNEYCHIHSTAFSIIKTF